MAGAAEAERIRCDQCAAGHYVVDATSDGSPRVRCNECGHIREGVTTTSSASNAGKWMVTGPDGKTMAFDTWEELTESRRPSAIAPTAKGMEEASRALKDLKPNAPQERKSGSALLDITPAPKLALADVDSAMDLGEPMSGSRRSRPSLTSTMTSATGSAPAKLEPLLVKSFSPPAKTTTPSKVEWAPKIDKSVLPPPVNDPTMRTEMSPSVTAQAKDEDRAPDSIQEIDSSSFIQDVPDEDEEAAPLSLRDVIQDEDEPGDSDDEDTLDPHEKLSLRDLVVVPNTGSSSMKAATSQPPMRASVPSQKPPLLPSQPPMKAAAATSQRPPKPPTPSQGPTKAAVAASQAPPPPRAKSLSRPDVRSDAPPKLSAPPPSIRPDVETPEEKKADKDAEKNAEKKAETQADTSRRKAVALPKEEEAPNRTWMWVAVAAVLLVGIFWRLSQNSEEPKPAEKPVATAVPPTPVTTPAMTNEAPPATPTASASETVAVTPPSATPAAPTSPAVVSNTPASTPVQPVTPSSAAAATPASAETKPTVANGESAGSMSELLDQAGSAKRKGDLATAHDLYAKVLAMSPNNVEANGGLGDVAKAQGDLAAAKASYERALAASPTYSPALLGLADVEWDSGNPGEAKKRYAQVVERMGDRAPARAKERSQ